MKIKHVEKLLDSMNRNNKDYLFVELMLAMGYSRCLVSPREINELEKLMDKKKIDYKPRFWWWEQYVKRLKFWWWMRRKPDDYSGISKTTLDGIYMGSVDLEN